MEKILKEILDKLEKLDTLEADIKELKELKPKIEESHQWLGALKHRTETMSATLGNLENQLAHLSGDIKAIKTSTEKDIYELKQGAGL